MVSCLVCKVSGPFWERLQECTLCECMYSPPPWSRVFHSSVFNGLWERQYENCLSWPEFVKASVEKAVLTKEHRLQGLLRCQRENSCREYFVTQEEWGSLPWQPRAVDSPCGAGWLGGHGPAKLPVERAAWRLIFHWRYSGQASSLP